uniref:CTCK domain-containing protein n=1 Tax=Clytia hemisphaerica TaxID=252671 RepID=A0A7M5WR96_9CNID
PFSHTSRFHDDGFTSVQKFLKQGKQLHKTMTKMNSILQLVCLVTLISFCHSASLVRRSVDGSASTPCAVKKMRMKIYEPGCGVVTVITKGCHGYCTSSSMYTNDKDALAIDCKFCKPKKTIRKMTVMKCPMLSKKTKVIAYREAVSCQCDGCPS